MISIVTAYYNRKVLFERTLQSIDRQIKEFGLSVEVIAVDDGSKEEERLEDLVVKYPFLKIIYLNPKDKWYKNSCIPFNIGFQEAKGEKIIIQNPECYHLGNILEYTEKNLKDNLYLSFGCYSLNKEITENLDSYLLDKKIYDCIEKNSCVVSNDGDLGWYNHSKYRPEAFHFCAAISRRDLLKLGGFDELFSLGIGYDDNEIIYRIRQKKIQIIFVDDEIVLHQNHYIHRKLSDDEVRYVNLLKDNNAFLFKEFTLKSIFHSRSYTNKFLNFNKLQLVKKIIRLIYFKYNVENYLKNNIVLFKFYLFLNINIQVRKQIKNPFLIPIIIINYNQLEYLKKNIEFYKKRGFKSIVIIDNNSTYPPLIEYYKSLENVTVERMDDNYGHNVFFENKNLLKKYGQGFYFLTDPDVIPNDNLPDNFAEIMLKKLIKYYLTVNKIGFALRIDDIPDYFPAKKNAIEWEKKYWEVEIEKNIFYGDIDTTFALYKPFSKKNNKISDKAALRMAGDYIARHYGWYVNPLKLTTEQEYYQKKANSSSSWNVSEAGLRDSKAKKMYE